MASAGTMLISSLLLGAVLLALVIGLQVFLSKRRSRLPGLVLPVVSLLGSFVYVLAYAVPAGGPGVEDILKLALILFLANIPTVILWVIYAVIREKKDELDKSKIRDLG